MALTDAERKRQERQRHREAGRICIHVHVLPKHRAAVRALERRLRKDG